MSKYLDSEMDQKGENRYENLIEQIKNVFGSNVNDNNIKTNEKYYTAVCIFAKYLGEFTGVNKISNVESKNIYKFIDKMQNLGMSDSTLKSYMSGIRNFYDMGSQVWDKCRTVIPDNNKLGLEDRIIGNVERAWSKEEITQAKELAVTEGRLDVYHALNIAEHFGTRIDGTCSITINQIDKALNAGFLHVVEKGAKPRNIPLGITEGAREALHDAKTWGESKETWKDHIFLQDKNIRAEKRSIQDWIANHRGSFQDADRIASWIAREDFRKTGDIEKSNLVFHGVRHAWACEKYQELKEQGYSKEKAMLQVSHWLGHERVEITKVYVTKV